MGRFESATLRRVCARVSTVEAVRVRPFFFPTLSTYDFLRSVPDVRERAQQDLHRRLLAAGSRAVDVPPGFCDRRDDRV
jgi:hypothetical protein